MRARILLVLVVLLAAPSAFATGEAINGFPNWQERVMHEWTNRARCDPQVEMTACGSACGDAACYTPIAPLPWNEQLNHAARFHSDEMKAQSYFAHDSICTLVSNIDALYPGSCTGAASCACVGGTATCSPTCTTWSSRVSLFGAGASGEIIASGTDPNGAFYQWLFEAYNKSTCGFDFGPPTNGHRYNILKAGPAVAYGAGTGPSVGDFGGSAANAKLISGSHYPRSAAAVDAWTNWYDSAGPKTSLVNVDGTCTAMTLGRGSVTNGAYHTQVTGLGTTCHRYFFVFTDSQNNLVTYPTTGSLGMGPANTCADWDTSRPTTGPSCSCTPQCSGKQCGDDGCGGACGNCTANQTCTNNQCVNNAPPDAGTSGDGGTTNGDAGVAKDGGGTNLDAGSNPDGGSNGDTGTGGCGCRTTNASSNGPWLVAFGAVAFAILRLRRRR